MKKKINIVKLTTASETLEYEIYFVIDRTLINQKNFKNELLLLQKAHTTINEIQWFSPILN